MNATLLYRIAGVVLLVFAIGHTFGFLSFKPSTPEGLAVLQGIKTVSFPIGSAQTTYNRFYVGFGLFVTAFLLFSAFLARHLGALAGHDPHAIGALGWVFFVLQIASLILSWIYFPAPPIVLSALLAVCVGWAAWLVR